MSTKELMTLRWKVIADFPGNEWFDINQIITANRENNSYKTLGGHEDWLQLLPENYPAIFKKLEWWEERKLEDLPIYLKNIRKNRILEIDNYLYSFGFVKINNCILSLHSFIPSTKEEYEKQNKYE